MGLTGTDLRAFVTEQMDKARQERAAHRELERAKAEAKAEAAKAEAKAAIANTETEKQKIQMDAEATKAKSDAETQQKNLELEFRNTSRDLFTIPQAPNLPMFADGTDDMNSFLERFERVAKIQGWESRHWAIMLSTLLSGIALDVYARLPSDDAMNYQVVKTALLKRYNMTEEGFRSRFRNARPQKGENPNQFITRIRSYLNHWIEMAEIKSYDAFKDLTIREQFSNICPQELTKHLKEDEFVSMENMCEQEEKGTLKPTTRHYTTTQEKRNHTFKLHTTTEQRHTQDQNKIEMQSQNLDKEKNATTGTR